MTARPAAAQVQQEARTGLLAPCRWVRSTRPPPKRSGRMRLLLHASSEKISAWASHRKAQVRAALSTLCPGCGRPERQMSVITNRPSLLFGRKRPPRPAHLHEPTPAHSGRRLEHHDPHRFSDRFYVVNPHVWADPLGLSPYPSRVEGGGWDVRGHNPLDIVPDGADMRVLKPDPHGGARKGVEYKWEDPETGNMVHLRVHDKDGTAPRRLQRGKRGYLPHIGRREIPGRRGEPVSPTGPQPEQSPLQSGRGPCHTHPLAGSISTSVQ